MSSPLLQVKDLHVTFRQRQGFRKRLEVRAVNGVSFDVHRGDVLAVVGESGSGKSTLGRTILQLIRPERGSVRFDGVELTGLSEKALRPFRRRLQIVFQDPYASLNPRMTVDELLVEALNAGAGQRLPRAKIDAEVNALLADVGLESAARRRYPHQFSGGQRQRIGIARVLAVKPELIVCDEPTSALDVSVQAQIVELLLELRAKRSLTYLFIAHDLALVRYVATRVAVMRAGQLIELGDAAQVYDAPQQEYTQALLAASPVVDPVRQRDRWLRSGAGAAGASVLGSPQDGAGHGSRQ